MQISGRGACLRRRPRTTAIRRYQSGGTWRPSLVSSRTNAGGLKIYLAQLPPSQRVVRRTLESALLLGIAHRKPVLDQDDSVIDEQLLEDRGLGKETVLLIRGAEPHHVLHSGPVISAPVHEHELARRGELADGALEVSPHTLPLSRPR